MTPHVKPFYPHERRMHISWLKENMPQPLNMMSRSVRKWEKMLAGFDINLLFWGPMRHYSIPAKFVTRKTETEWGMSERGVCGWSHHSRKGAIKDRLPFIPCSPGHQLGAAGNEAQHSSTTSARRWQTLTRGRNYGIWNRRDIIHPSPP